MTAKTVYDLELHECFKIDKFTFCQRVPSGWIYLVRSCEDSPYLPIFVPEPEETITYSSSPLL